MHFAKITRKFLLARKLGTFVDARPMFYLLHSIHTMLLTAGTPEVFYVEITRPSLYQMTISQPIIIKLDEYYRQAVI